MAEIVVSRGVIREHTFVIFLTVKKNSQSAQNILGFFNFKWKINSQPAKKIQKQKNIFSSSYLCIYLLLFYFQSGEFNWDGDRQGLVLGSFFYGYILTQVPGGYLGERYGGKWLYGVGVLCTSVFTLLTPIAARIHVYVFLAVRILEGIGEVSTFMGFIFYLRFLSLFRDVSFQILVWFQKILLQNVWKCFLNFFL